MALPTALVLILSVGIPVYIVVFTLAMLVMWRVYIKVGRRRFHEKDTDAKGLTEEFPTDYLMTIPQQKGIRFLHEVFERSAERFPTVCAVRVASQKWGLSGASAHSSEEGQAKINVVGEQTSRIKEALGLILSGVDLLPHHINVSYKDLNKWASRISEVLLTGIAGDHPDPYVSSPDEIVAVLLPRICTHIFAAQLGVLKAGAAVLMLDANLPDAVLQFQLSDSKPVALLTLDCYLEKRSRHSGMGVNELKDILLCECKAATVDVERVFPGTHSNFRHNASNALRVVEQLRPSHLAMVIYTSGTTGKPKAVLVEHASYVNYILDYCNYMSFVPNYDVHGQMASLSFDASVEEVYGAWCAGAPLVVFTDDHIRSGPDLVPLLCDEAGLTATPVNRGVPPSSGGHIFVLREMRGSR